MDLQTYQAEALKTALPNALALHNYLAPGLFAEVGEVLQVFAKGFRDDTRTHEYMPKVGAEYGDCYWMCGTGLHVHGVHDSPARKPIDVPWSHAVDELARQAAHILDNPQEVGRWRHMWALLDVYCEAVTGKTPREVKEANLAKLADRANRGKIGGSGDAR